MSSTLQTHFSRTCILVAVLLFSLLLLSTAMPQKASAAVVSLSTATTSSNNTASTTLAKVADVISYRLTLDGVPSATTTPLINIFNTGSTTMFAVGATSSAAVWTYSTTTTNTTVWANGFVTFYMGWGGSLGEATSTFSSAASTSLTQVRFDKAVPTISTLTSNATAAGVLKVGNTIVFTLTPGATEYGATVAGSYNAQALSWSTADGGVTFTATYTVVEGETDRTTALQISGVIITDAAVNASSAGAGTDIVKTIDANSPATPTASPVAGVFSSTQSVVLSSSNSDSIRYTADNSTPSCSVGTVYSSAISVDSTQTIKAIGCDVAENTASEIASLDYTISRSNSGGGKHVAPSATPAVPSPTPTSPGSGLSGSQIDSILDILRSFGADAATIANFTAALMGQPSGGTGAPASASTFARDLDVGSTGADVKALQQFLNTHGYSVAATGPGSSGNETTTFGGLTQAALATFQAAKGITPTVGYFGPKTRAIIAGM